MPEPQLSVRSARAKLLAHNIAKRERRSISQVVELALENYARLGLAVPDESPRDFWTRLVSEGRVEGEPDIDLQALIDENRQMPRDIEF